MEVSASLTKLKLKYQMDEQDIAFCDLVNCGWTRNEAALYAYRLAYADPKKIKTFLTLHMNNKKGIEQYLADLSQEKALNELNIEERIRKAVNTELNKAKQEHNAELARVKEEMKAEMTAISSDEHDLRTKEGMLETLIGLAEGSRLDAKTKADLLKQITDLMGYKKEEIKTEDTRIHFYLPLTCAKCELFRAEQERKRNEIE